MGAKLVPALLLLALAPVADASQPTLAGAWQRLPEAPAAATIPFRRAAVWTGTQLLVFGRAPVHGAVRNVAASYTPATRRWRMLSPPLDARGEYEGSIHAVWTGKRMLVWEPYATLSYDPTANRWRRFPHSPLVAGAGVVVWTGSEMLGWGGGCCGDATNAGAAFDPATGRWRRLARPPVAGQQVPAGAWTGRELVVLPGRSPLGRPTGGAAYDPRSDRWRRIAPPPQERLGASAVWDGRELLVVGGARYATGGRPPVAAAVALAYDPTTDGWRTLAAMDGGRYGRLAAAAAWTGARLLLWGGETVVGGRYALAPHGLAYDPRANRWSQLPAAPLAGRLDPAVVWTGTSLLVWGGDPLEPSPPGTAAAVDRYPFLDGAAFAPGA